MNNNLFLRHRKKIVAELDKYIIGQNDAKRNVAIALRNRWEKDEHSFRKYRVKSFPIMFNDRGQRVWVKQRLLVGWQNCGCSLYGSRSFQIYGSGVCRS